MSRSMPKTRAVIPSFLVLAVAASCGHSQTTLGRLQEAPRKWREHRQYWQLRWR